jgi:excisionase family DNA binding protein
MQLLDVREAAEEARVLSAYIYWAIAQGTLKAQREGRRVFIPRNSFEQWKSRLDTRRKIREEEKQLVSVAAKN